MSDFRPKFLQPAQWLSWQRRTHDPDWSEHRYRDSKDQVIMHLVGEVEALVEERSANRRADMQLRSSHAGLVKALEVALKFCEDEQECREHSFLPEPTKDEKGYLTEASETVDAIRAALANAKKVIS